MPWVVPKGQPSRGPPALSHLPHSQRPSPNSTCPPHSHSPCTHIHTYTIPQSRKCGGMCTHLCHTDPSTSEPTGRTFVSHNSGGSFAHEHMCADHVPSHTHTDSRSHHESLCLRFLICVSVFESLKWPLIYRMDVTIVPIPGEVIV